MSDRTPTTGWLSPKMRTFVLLVAGTLAVVAAIECHVAVGSRVANSPWIPSLFYGSVWWFWWAGLILLLWRAGNRWPSLLKFSLKSTALQFVFALVFALFHLYALHSAVHFIAERWPELGKAGYSDLVFFDVGHFSIELLLYALVWCACAAGYAQLLAQRSLTLEKQLADAQLRALQLQIEPHFLFNTLNTLTALVELDRRNEALQALTNLNAILRTALRRNAPGKIPLAQELHIAESYLEIERMRFSDRLCVDIQIDPKALDAMVPSFLLQPIIENAVRHGIAHCENEGHIETSARVEGKRVELRVRDSGNGQNEEEHKGFGIGLSNTRERLAHFYKDDYEFGVSRPETGGFEVVINIPYEQAKP